MMTPRDSLLAALLALACVGAYGALALALRTQEET